MLPVKGSDDIPVGYLRECFAFDDMGRLKWCQRPLAHFPSEQAQRCFNDNYAGKSPAGAAHVRLRIGRRFWLLRSDHVTFALRFGRWPTGRNLTRRN